MTWSMSYATELASIGFYQLLFSGARNHSHCTMGDVSEHAFSFLCQGSSPAKNRLLSWKSPKTPKPTNSSCFTWYVKRRNTEAKSWQCLTNVGTGNCCKVPKEKSFIWAWIMVSSVILDQHRPLSQALLLYTQTEMKATKKTPTLHWDRVY